MENWLIFFTLFTENSLKSTAKITTLGFLTYPGECYDFLADCQLRDYNTKNEDI